MGYTTEFEGSIAITPPLNTEEIAFLKKFNDTRRMKCEQGPYYVDRGGHAGQAAEAGIIDYNEPPNGQPGLWCQWTPTDDGAALEWDGGEKFHCAAEWMKYLIEHFLKEGCLAASELSFLTANHVLNGTIEAQGEDSSDRWDLVVTNNKVSVKPYEFTAKDAKEL